MSCADKERIGNPKGHRGVWLAPGATVNRRFRGNMHHGSQKIPPKYRPKHFFLHLPAPEIDVDQRTAG